jgi:hypothetical protein
MSWTTIPRESGGDDGLWINPLKCAHCASYMVELAHEPVKVMPVWCRSCTTLRLYDVERDQMSEGGEVDRMTILRRIRNGN